MAKKKQSQKDPWWIYVIAAFIGGIAIGMVLPSTGGHDHGHTLPHGHEEHHHELYNVPNVQSAPSVELIVHEDPKSGWNLQLQTQNFEFAPQAVGGEHVEGKGHAHLYIDGQKITRVYSEWFRLPELESGRHMVSVSLSTNDHMEYAINDERVAATQIITVE